MLLCQHEKIAVQIAHGYAKATGQPLAVIVHNVVGLLHATMGIYYAYTDRAPVFVIGATGPMDEGKRRPRVDWAAHRQRAGHAGPRLCEMGLSAGRHRRRGRQLRPRLFDHDDRAARPDLHVLRRRHPGSAAGGADRAARRRLGQGAEPHRARSGGAGGGGRPAGHGRLAGAAAAIRRPRQERLFRHGGASPRRSARRSSTRSGG